MSRDSTQDSANIVYPEVPCRTMAAVKNASTATCLQTHPSQLDAFLEAIDGATMQSLASPEACVSRLFDVFENGRAGKPRGYVTKTELQALLVLFNEEPCTIKLEFVPAKSSSDANDDDSVSTAIHDLPTVEESRELLRSAASAPSDIEGTEEKKEEQIESAHFGEFVLRELREILVTSTDGSDGDEGDSDTAAGRAEPKLFVDLDLSVQATFIDFSVRTLCAVQRDAQHAYQDVLDEKEAAAKSAAAENAKPEFVLSDVSVDCAMQLATVTGDALKRYVQKMYEGFEGARKLRAEQIKYLESIRTSFHAFLRRASGEKTEAVQSLQKAINDLPQDMRFDEECKAELTQRAEDHVSS